MDHLGAVDFAFLNAGVNVPGDDQDATKEVWTKTIEINLNGAYRTARIAHEIMREHNHGGSLARVQNRSATPCLGVVPEKLRTLDHGRPWRDDQFASTRLSSSRDMSR